MRFCTRHARWVPALAALFLAAPAAAGEVAEVRIGQHPTFTRVVFELDAPAGYGVTHSTAADGAAQVRVTLDAATQSRRIESRSRLVERVDLDSSGDGTAATIRLRESGLIAKELMLPDPPRIVLDFMREDALSASMAEPAAADPTPETAAETVAEPASAATVVAVAPPAPVVTPIAPPVPVVIEEIAEAEAPPAMPAAPAPVAESETDTEPVPAMENAEDTTAPVAEVPDSEWAESDAAVEAVAEIEDPVAATDEGAAEIDEAVAGVESDELAIEEPPTPLVPASDASAPTLARSMSSPTQDDAQGSGDSPVSLSTLVAGGGVLALVLVAGLVLRRRQRANDVDLSVIPDEDASDAGRMPAEGFAVDGPPMPEPMPVWKPEPAMDTDSTPTDSDEEPADESDDSPFDTSADSLFAEESVETHEGAADADSDAGFGEPEEKEDDMETQVTTSPVSMQQPMGGSMDSGVEQLVRDLAARVAQLESRLDQSVEAREKLEHQVAAQAEELRVQRAAIARTQRALRSMNRPEEEQATEPALRDPSKS